jgi:hypothetical protein
VKNKIVILLASVSLAVFVAILLFACANTASLKRKHPVEIQGLVNCSDCHKDRWGALNHKADNFDRRHKYYAGQQQRACTPCHRESFCTDCHAYREEIMPSDKYKGSPERMLPHRGDFLSRHRIEGKIDPVSCLKCHGRQNNERCRLCHR